MKKITETELKNKVSRLREYLTILEDNPGMGPYDAPPAPGMGQKGPTVAAAQGADPSNPLNKAPTTPASAPVTAQSTKPAGAPKVAYDTNFPEATAKELQTKLNAAGEKLTVDGKMGPATRAAMARHPEITSNPNAPAAAPAAAPAPAPTMTAADQDDADMGAAMAANAQAAKETEIGANQDAEDAAMGAAMTANVAAAAPAPAAPAAPAAWTPTPEQAKWLGGADQQDPYILSRMPGVKPPVTHFKDPADQAKAKQMKFPAAPAPAAPAAAAPAPAPTATAGTPPTAMESVSFQNEELSRIVSLVRHR